MATTTITTTAAQDARIVVAFGRELNLRDANGAYRNATAAEVKALVIQRGLVEIVQKQEAQMQLEALVPPAVITPS